jgi:NAD(P)-dependent dehydrogenase (short-subunit alcohol dehydrogenase family)
MERLQGRTAVVTGAASGIGLAVVEAFVVEGMHVVMADVDEPALAGVAPRLVAEGAEVHPTSPGSVPTPRPSTRCSACRTGCGPSSKRPARRSG